MIHAVDQGNISAYKGQFRTVSVLLRDRLAGCTSADPLRAIYALPYDAPEFSYSLSLFPDETLRHCIQAFRVCSPNAGRERSQEVWTLELIDPTPRPHAASDPILLETFVGALEGLVDLGARRALCRPNLIARVGVDRVRAIAPLDAADGQVRVTLNPADIDDVAKAAGLERPIAYHVDPEEVSALQSLSAVERMFTDLRRRLAAQPGPDEASPQLR